MDSEMGSEMGSYYQDFGSQPGSPSLPISCAATRLRRETAGHGNAVLDPERTFWRHFEKDFHGFAYIERRGSARRGEGAATGIRGGNRNCLEGHIRRGRADEG